MVHCFPGMEGCAMGQFLHGSATTTEVARRAIRRELLSRCFQMINAINPSTHGKQFVANIAERLGALPKDGVHEIALGLRFDLDLNDFVERSMYFGSFDPMVNYILRDYLSEGATSIKKRANVGYYTLQAAAR